MKHHQKIREICINFLIELGEHATDTSVFPILAEEAEKQHLILEAYQRGIQGTYVCFTETEMRRKS